MTGQRSSAKNKREGWSEKRQKKVARVNQGLRHRRPTLTHDGDKDLISSFEGDIAPSCASDRKRLKEEIKKRRGPVLVSVPRSTKKAVLVTPEMLAGWMALEERRREKWRVDHPAKYAVRKPPVAINKTLQIPRAAIRKLTYNATLTDEQWERRQGYAKTNGNGKKAYARLKERHKLETPEEREKRLAVLRARAARLVWAGTFAKKNNYHVATAFAEVVPMIAMNARMKHNLGDDPALLTNEYLRGRKYEEISRPERVGQVFKGSFKKTKDVKRQIEIVKAVLDQAL
jgi:hypothetical protein